MQDKTSMKLYNPRSNIYFAGAFRGSRRRLFNLTCASMFLSFRLRDESRSSRFSISGKPEKIFVDFPHRRGIRWPPNISADVYNTFKSARRGPLIYHRAPLPIPSSVFLSFRGESTLAPLEPAHSQYLAKLTSEPSDGSGASRTVLWISDYHYYFDFIADINA